MPFSHLIVATAGRALARSAWRSRHPVAVLDLFADRDTRCYASACQRLSAPDWDLDPAATVRAANDVCPAPVPLVPGSGFEGHPALLSELARGRKLLGNTPEVVAASKDPQYFFPLLERLGIDHPETSSVPPVTPEGWLVKRIGGCGGTHVRPVRAGEIHSPEDYFQRRVAGTFASVLFVADGRETRVVGFNETWVRALGDTPFAYAGAINRLALSPGMRRRISRDLDRIAGALGLVGLNGMDFVITGNEYRVLEINPRPTATIDLHDDHAAGSLFDLHVRACAGSLPGDLQVSAVVRAHAVVYMPAGRRGARKIDFPPWCRDLPSSAGDLRPGMPACTVNASGRRVAEVRRQIRRRRSAVHRLLGGEAA